MNKLKLYKVSIGCGNEEIYVVAQNYNSVETLVNPIVDQWNERNIAYTYTYNINSITLITKEIKNYKVEQYNKLIVQK